MTPEHQIDDELWAEIEPLIPPRERRSRHAGRKPLPDRAVLNGILYVRHHRIPWDHLPQDYGYGSGVTCWRRLREWQSAGVWDALERQVHAARSAHHEHRAEGSGAVAVAE